MSHSEYELSDVNINNSLDVSLTNYNDICEKSVDWRNIYKIYTKEIGRGHFSKVYHVFCNNRNTSFAAKVIKRHKSGIDTLDSIKKESTLIMKLNRLNVHSIIKLFHIYENLKEVALILELASGGSLFTLVEDSMTGLHRDYVKVVTYKLLVALEAMHKENIVHLDIKADNILLRESYPSTDIVLCDFGLAIQLTEGKCHRELAGTPDYMAPEVINYENICVNTDMWSVGVSVYYLLTKVSPFVGGSKNETLTNVSKAIIPFGSIFSESEYTVAKDLISSLCVKSPELRLSSMSALKHEWFSNVNDVNFDFLTANSDTDEIIREIPHKTVQSVEISTPNMFNNLSIVSSQDYTNDSLGNDVIVSNDTNLLISDPSLLDTSNLRVNQRNSKDDVKTFVKKDKFRKQSGGNPFKFDSDHCSTNACIEMVRGQGLQIDTLDDLDYGRDILVMNTSTISYLDTFDYFNICIQGNK